MLIKQIIVVVFSSVLIACAGADSRPDTDDEEVSNRRTDCISRSSIRGYEVLDEQNLIVTGNGRRKYHMSLRRRAYGLRTALGIDFDTSGMRVCAGFDALRYGDRNDVVRIATIVELSPEDYEDLLIRFGKKDPEIEQLPAPQEVKGAEIEELDPAAKDESSGN